jgi:hypothetical protein
VKPLDEFIENIRATAATDGPPAFARGVVATVAAGTPPTVTVDWNGAVVPAVWPKSLAYTPVVGDVVLIARFGPQLLILHAY